MIISAKRRYIFVHIPKTGGTSMALALEARAAADDILIGDTPKARKRKQRLKGVRAAGRLWKHSTLRDADGLIDRAQMRAFFVFTLVRNPWDRLVSYYHWLQDQSFDHPAVELAKTLEFEAFALHPSTAAAFRTAPYASYLTGPDGVDYGDLYIRLEHFAEDAAPLERHLGFSLDLPHENASRRRTSHREYYSDASRQAVGAFCAEDITRFGYRF